MVFLVQTLSFGKRLSHFHPNRSNSFLDISYTRESFFIQVSPTRQGLFYMPYESENIIPLQSGDVLSMFTVFEEINGTFQTPNIAILPTIYSLLFMGDIQEVFTFSDKWETRLGAYYATFQKPYMISQTTTEGVTGDKDFIYNARFNAVGIVERYGFFIDWFEFTFQHNLGIARVKIQENEELKDSESHFFFHYKMVPTFSFQLPMAKQRIVFSAAGSFDWGFIWGGKYDIYTLKFDTTGFFNDDFIFKFLASVTIRL